MTQLEKLVLPLELKNGITGALAGITAAVTAFSALATLAVTATFKWAGELDSLQDIMGITNKQAAALNFVLRKSGVGTEKFTKATTFLNKGLLDSKGNLDVVGKALKQYGINVKDANDITKDQTAIIDEISKKYDSMSTQQERVNFLVDVFGKSGADLVDFFDTLSKEGGIDKVTDKIEKLGLAIDPQRYENFSRSLEELKLIGLSMAVGFTEKVMPALEGLISILTDPNLSVSQKLTTIFSKADELIGGWVDSLAQAVEDWVNGNGPQELSDKLIKWIENLGTGDEFNSKTLTAAGRLVSAIIKAIKEFDWSGVGDAIKNKLDEQLVKGLGINTDQIITALKIGTLVAGLTALITFLGAAAEGFMLLKVAIGGLALSEGLASLPGILGKLALSIGALDIAWSGLALSFGVTGGVLIAAILLVGVAIAMLITNWDLLVQQWELFKSNPPLYISTFLYELGSAINDLTGGALDRLGEKFVQFKIELGLFFAQLIIDAKKIGEEFSNVVGGWIVNATYKLTLRLAGFYGFLERMVNTINEILSGILGIEINLPGFGGSSGVKQKGGKPTSNGSGGNRRASGGDVIPGQKYRINEFFGEAFIPSMNGRVERDNKEQPIIINMDEERIVRLFRDAILMTKS